MNAFQICHNITDISPLYLPQQLYLKPIARVNISLQLPNVKKLGKSVSHWEIMDKIRVLLRPDEFTTLKVTKTTVEFVRLEGELETRSALERVLTKLDNKMIKLKDFGELMRLKAAEWKSDFPNRRIWDEFFQNARDMDEMKPGQRPDTVYISNLPSKWFVPYHLSGEENIIPSEKIFYRVFEKFGLIRFVDIPICDPYRKKMKEHISGVKNSSFETTEFFEGYVQFKDYIGFTKAMDTFRNTKLVHKEDDTAVEVNIKVDFDKSKHLSDASIRRREIVRDRLVRKAREQEEKDKAELEEKKKKEDMERKKELDLKEEKKIRRKLREEKRKAKILEKLEISGSDEINEKIAREEKKLLKVQRKLEAIRLVEELFRRTQEKNSHDIQLYDDFPNHSYNELKQLKNSSELEVLNQKEILHNALKGRVMLKTVLADRKKLRHHSSSSSDSDISLALEKSISEQKPKGPVFHKYPELMFDPSWIGLQHYLPPGPIFPDSYHHMGGFIPRGRGFPRVSNIAGPSRFSGYNRRRAGYRYRGSHRGGGNFNNFAPDLGDEFLKFLSDQEDRQKKSYSPNRKSRHRSRSRSKRSYTRSYTHSRSRSKTRKRSRSRRSRSYSYRSSRSRSRSKRSYTRSRSRSKSKRRSRSRSRSRENDRRKKSRSNSRYRDKTRSKSPESKEKHSNFRQTKSNPYKDEKSSSVREKSVDSSSFMTPQQLQQKRGRSKSWSLPREAIDFLFGWLSTTFCLVGCLRLFWLVTDLFSLVVH